MRHSTSTTTTSTTTAAMAGNELAHGRPQHAQSQEQEEHGQGQAPQHQHQQHQQHQQQQADNDDDEDPLLAAYPHDCPFCSIAAAYPYAAASDADAESATAENADASDAVAADASAAAALLRSVPVGAAADPQLVEPSAFVVLAAQRVLAFLDILPMTRGHLLVTTRRHRGKVEELVGEGEEGRDVGFWLPLLAKTVARVTGVTDYNIVQNNGIRAAQVVPHVHFHIIPRPPAMPELKNKSWAMFGRGQRDDLDDDEAVALAGEMRRVLLEEVERLDGRGRGSRL